jgi:hypothetical protein
VSTERTVAKVRAEAKALIDQHDRSGSKLRPLTKKAWQALSDRCVSDAVNAGEDDVRYTESVTLASLCLAMARATPTSANERKLASAKWRKNKAAS